MSESKKNEYLKTMKPILYLMRIVSAIPLRIKTPLNEIPRFISSKTVCYVATIVGIFCHGHFSSYLIDMLISKCITSIPMLVVKGVEILYELFCMAIPMLMWNRNEEVQDYWDAWGKFQSKYEAISDTPLISKKKKFINTAILVLLLWISWWNFYCASYHNFIYSGIVDYGYLVNMYLFFLVCTVAMYWFVNYVYFQSISEDMLILGKKIIAEKKNDNFKMNKLVSLWLSLSDLTNNFNEVHSFVFLAFFTVKFFYIVVCAYAALNYSTYKDIYPMSFYTNVLLTFVLFLLMFCETANSVNYQINYLQKEALLLENTMQMETPVLQSLLTFIQTISSRNPTIHLNGYFDLNRMTIPAVVSLCINFLIVLRQFSDG